MEDEHAKTIPELAIETMNLMNDVSSAEETGDASAAKYLITKHISKYTKKILDSTQKILYSHTTQGCEWLNVSKPLNFQEDFKKSIVVMDFFTYCCINCLHILPDLEVLEEEYKPNESPVIVIGVHSAKFENEKLLSSLSDAIDRYHISHPVINDNDCKLWHTLQISCWPTVVILGPGCIPLFVLMGEGHRDFLLKAVYHCIVSFANDLEIMKVPLQLSGCVASSFDKLSFPGKVTCYQDGIIIADSGNNRIIITDYLGNIKEVVGSGLRSLEDGSFHESAFSNPQGVVYLHPFIFVADTDNHCIRKIDLEEKRVETIAGSGVQSSDKEGGLFWINQGLSSPWDLCVAHSFDVLSKDTPPNILLVAMAGNHQIWGIFLSDGAWLKKSFYSKGCVVRLAGSGVEENRNTSYPLKAGFAQPSGITLLNDDGKQIVFVADSESSSIRQFSLADGSVTRVIGANKDPTNLFTFGDVDGSTNDALLQHPLGIANGGNCIFVADSFNHKIKIIKSQGKHFTSETLLGTGESGNNMESFLTVQLNEPSGLCFKSDTDELFIADTNNHCIKVLHTKKKTVEKLKLNFKDFNVGKNLEEDTVDSADDGIIINFAPCRDEVLLKLNITLPPTTKLNHDAKNTFKIIHRDENIEVEKMMGDILETDLTLAVRFINNKMAAFIIQLTLFICSDDALCLMKDIQQKFTLTRNSTGSVDNISEATVSIVL